MHSRRPVAAHTLLALGVIAFASCDSSTEPRRASEITFLVASLTMDAIGATQAILPTVRDQHGKAMPGVTVTWSSNAIGVATVSATGTITATGNGDAAITAALGAATADLPVHVAQVPVAPAVIGGDAQSAQVATTLTNLVSVRVVDRLGVAIAGRDVQFVVTQGGGTVATPNALSALNGLASTAWTLGTSSTQPQQLSASVTGSVALTVLTATALAGPAAGMAFAPANSGEGQSVPRGTAAPIRPAVRVSDTFGNGVAGVTVNFAVLSGGGSVTGAAAITNGSGIATVGSWIVGDALGPNTLEATLGAFPPVLFTASAVEDPCTPAGAPVLAIGGSVSSTISVTDCQLPAPEFHNFRLYRLVVPNNDALFFSMTATFDAWLSILDFDTQVVIVENDDILSGVITDSRIVTALDPGTYLLRARTFDPGQTGSFTLSVRLAVLGVPSVVAPLGADGQVGAPGGTVLIPPAVVVRDEGGYPVAGVPVTFATLPGIGSVTGADAVTDANGVATVGSWTVAAGPNVVSATVAGANVESNPIVFSATGAASTAGFNINLRFATMPTLVQLQTFGAAAARWESIVTGDLPLQAVDADPGQCGNPIGIQEDVDDVAIVVRLVPIDGNLGVLGSAGPCAIRALGLLPSLGIMEFDTADLAWLEANGWLGAVLLHEMGHVLGIGTLWSAKGFLKNPSWPSSSGADTHFDGASAIAGFNTIGGSTWTGTPGVRSKVPVANTGGGGSQDSHWRENVLQNELMTPSISSNTNPLSVLTIRSLEDLGYAVNTGPADAFFLALAFRAPGDAASDLHLKDDIWRGGMVRVDRYGRPVQPLSTRSPTKPAKSTRHR